MLIFLQGPTLASAVVLAQLQLDPETLALIEKGGTVLAVVIAIAGWASERLNRIKLQERSEKVSDVTLTLVEQSAVAATKQAEATRGFGDVLRDVVAETRSLREQVAKIEARIK